MSDAAKMSVPSAAPELVQRLTTAMGIPFTLTDRIGAVVASSHDQPRGHIEPIALAVLREGKVVERSGPGPARWAVDELGAPDAAATGLLASGEGVYLPLTVNGRVDGVLIAHGPPDEIRGPAYAAAAAAALALDFARGASVSARQGLAPDVALHQLLRGSRAEARRAAMVAKVMGWDLTVPRIALVIRAPETNGALGSLGPDQFAMIAKFVDTVAPGTPYAQLEMSEWVLLPEVSALVDRPSPQQFAEDVRTGLFQAGVAAALGLGDTHAERSLVALRRSYREAAYAARYGERLHGRNRVYLLRDLGAAAFLTPNPATRRRLARRLVQPLRAEPELIRSLEAFLNSDCSLANTAQSTGLHRHTIRHHILRIRELTGLDPRTLTQALELHLALFIDSHQLPDY